MWYWIYNNIMCKCVYYYYDVWISFRRGWNRIFCTERDSVSKIQFLSLKIFFFWNLRLAWKRFVQLTGKNFIRKYFISCCCNWEKKLFIIVFGFFSDSICSFILEDYAVENALMIELNGIKALCYWGVKIVNFVYFCSLILLLNLRKYQTKVLFPRILYSLLQF